MIIGHGGLVGPQWVCLQKLSDNQNKLFATKTPLDARRLHSSFVAEKDGDSYAQDAYSR